MLCSFLGWLTFQVARDSDNDKEHHHVKSFLLFSALLFAASMAAQQPASQPKQGSQPAQQQQPGPHPKTQAELTDYNAAAVTTGGAAMEKAADDFAAKYPDSEMRENLYLRAMHEYQTENQAPKSLEMAQKVLQLDTTNSVALVISAMVLSDELTQPNPDPQKVAEITKNANLAIQTIDTSFKPPVQATPEQLAAYKDILKGNAHSALGVTDLKTQNYAAAETELKAATDLTKAHPDPFNWYYLALAQDHLKKYSDAVATANEGLKYAGTDPNVTKLLQDERDKATKAAGSAPAK